MDLLQVLPAVVGLWCVAFLARIIAAARAGVPAPLGWTIKAALALVATGAAVVQESAPWIYGLSAAWAVFLLVPAVAAQRRAADLEARRFGRARVFAEVVRALHPFDGWRSGPRLTQALARAQEGDPNAADTLRALAEADAIPAGARATVWGEIARLTGDWDGLLNRDPATPGIAPLRLRALGETGRLPELAAEYEALRAAEPFADLILLAFSGRVRGVTALVERGPFAGLEANAKAFWIATAAVAGDPGDAAARAAVVSSAQGPQREALIARRLNGGLASTAGLAPDVAAAIDRFEADVVEGLAAAPAPGPAARPVVTVALILANLVAFGAELVVGGWGGPTDLKVLYSLGGLWPPAVMEGGEWWRLGAAMFLHFGAVHLALNMVALAGFGRIVEPRVGAGLMAALYAVTGLGSMLGVLALGQALRSEPELLIGASGAIFGVVGVFGGLLVRDVLGGVLSARRRLLGLGAVVALQVVFDTITPEVSMSAHALGFAIGLACGLAIAGRVTPRRR